MMKEEEKYNKEGEKDKERVIIKNEGESKREWKKKRLEHKGEKENE